MNSSINNYSANRIECEASYSNPPQSYSASQLSALMSIQEPPSTIINLIDDSPNLSLSRSSPARSATITSSSASATSTYHEQSNNFSAFKSTTVMNWHEPPAQQSAYDSMDFHSATTAGNNVELTRSRPLTTYPSTSDVNREVEYPAEQAFYRRSRIHVNPSILLSQHRANFPGIGTPMPVLPTNNFQLPWARPDLPRILPKTPANIPVIEKRRNKSKKSKRQRRRQLLQNTCLSPKSVAKFLLTFQNQNVSTCGSDSEDIDLGNEKSTVTERQRKQVDAREWLKAKAQLVAREREKQQQQTRQSQSDSTNKTNREPIRLETSSFKYKRFVDRATSPIDFKDTEINPKTHDVALSPIRFIESNLKRRQRHSDENSIDSPSSTSTLSLSLAQQSRTIPLKHKCFLAALEHKCSKCKISQPQSRDGGSSGGNADGKSLECPTCRALDRINSSK